MDRRARTIMFQGTGSGVGKSVAAAAFCRVLARRGVRVVPFKAQNMALNSFVTPDGKEMGRAQVFQAEACGLAPDVRMNPILLKPSADAASQVIVMGEAVGHYSARAYYQEFEAHRRVAREAFDALAAEYEVVVLEGAGSPAEINLQDTDLVNMDMAAHARAPVVLVGDIDRGGVFAWIKGTYDLIPEAHRGLVAGFLVNKFRGDPGLLRPGIEAFARLVPVPCLGVLPMFRDIEVDQEDGVHVEALERRGARRPIRVVVVRPERISNFTDFGSLAAEPDVSLVFARRPEEAEGADCLVLPGTKATMADLEILRRAGWGEALAAAAADGVPVVGL
ncbi:cobyric acid synthase, partial [Dissulfurirhabdus thermomarina]